MSNRQSIKTPIFSRLVRIERKCNLILSELVIMRRNQARSNDDVDAAIERMHTNARRLKMQAVHDARLLRSIIHSKQQGDGC